MSGKIMTALAAALLLASAGLASAQTQAPRHDRAVNTYRGYYNMVPNQLPKDPTPDWSNGTYPFPVTGQGGF
jgi:hypothetical protein